MYDDNDFSGQAHDNNLCQRFARILGSQILHIIQFILFKIILNFILFNFILPNVKFDIYYIRLLISLVLYNRGRICNLFKAMLIYNSFI